MIKKCDDKKEKAVALIKDGLYERAIDLLKEAVDFADETGPHREESGELDY